MSIREVPSSPAPSTSRALQFWRGRTIPTGKRGSIIVSAAFFVLSIGLVYFGLATLRWPMPLKPIGGICLVVALVLFLFGLRAAVRVLLHIGARGTLLRLAMLYVAAVVSVAILRPSLATGTGHWLASAATVHRTVLQALTAGVQSVTGLPDAIAFASTGQRSPLAGANGVVPTPIAVRMLAVTDVQAANQSNGSETATVPPNQPKQGELAIGRTARIVGTEGRTLRARAEPGTNAAIIARFPVTAKLTIIGGPQSVDGLNWWQVRGPQGEGWCSGEFMEVEQEEN